MTTAIATQSLRAVDRYGVTRDGQQFAGFKAIPAQTGTSLSVEQAVELLSKHSGISLNLTEPNFAQCRVAFRTARARTHPDTGNGNADSVAWHVVEAAGKRLAAHFGTAL
jgi:hypothetical protein